jgi:hypothetical protein
VTHIYITGGVYTVKLWVRDDDYPYSADEGSEIGETIMIVQVTANDATVENIDLLLPSPPPPNEDFGLKIVSHRSWPD